LKEAVQVEVEKFCLFVLGAAKDELVAGVEADALAVWGEADFVSALSEGGD